ncbi:Ribosome production factor 1 [Cryptotrichosporon argae]
MGRDKKIQNAVKRSDVHRKSRREKEQSKLKRRMEIRKAERGEGGEQLKAERLAKNVPRTIDNTRLFDSSSYLTADPAALRAAEARAAEASKRVNGVADEDDGMDEDDDDEGEEDRDDEGAEAAPDAGPSGSTGEPEEEAETPAEPPVLADPRILITTSPGPSKPTYHFCDDLKSVFPGGEFFKRPKGRGFEMGRVARWAAKRGFNAVVVVNEDHKKPNAITLINLPAGPTAYFKLSSVQLSADIYAHARPTPHSPELILNNFTTLLGNAVGRMFGQLFPPLPQFRGRQVVTLHNQRDFLFFRRHRYQFDSPTAARLQEIGPRFTLKLRWMRKGLPAVTAGDGRMPGGGDKEAELTDEEDKMDEDEARAEIGTAPQPNKVVTPALDEEQEYEWKWKPKMEVSRRTFFL